MDPICTVCGWQFTPRQDRRLNRRHHTICPECERQQKDARTNRLRKEISAGLRWRVLSRDNFTCQYCGQSPQFHGVPLHVDHIIPITLGGTNDIANLITACERCNIGKGASGEFSK